MNTAENTRNQVNTLHNVLKQKAVSFEALRPPVSAASASRDLSCVTVLACPHDLHPSVDLSFSTVLLHVVLGLPRFL